MGSRRVTAGHQVGGYMNTGFICPCSRRPVIEVEDNKPAAEVGTVAFGKLIVDREHIVPFDRLV